MLAACSAWPASPSEAFEVASIKLAGNQNSVPGVAGAPPIPSGLIATLSLTHATLHGLLMRAFGVRYSSVAGPSWMDSTYYDVTAKVPPGTQGQQLGEMLQNLLVERFAIRHHWETMAVSGWGIVTGREHLQMKRTSLAGSADVLEPDGMPNRRVTLTRNDRTRTLNIKGFSMQGLASAAWGELGEPVEDLTGLKGAFDFILEGETDNPADVMAGMSAASLKKSLRSYGLDLVRQKVQVKTLRVDAANRTPKPN
jgi:uncharacterized protein (TIGR03435 family)